MRRTTKVAYKKKDTSMKKKKQRKVLTLKA